MSVTKPKSFHHHGERSVIAGMTMEPLRQTAIGLERREQYRRGGTREEARERLARQMGLMPGTLFNLVRDRLKRLDDNLRERVVSYAIKEIEAEIGALEHELAMVRAVGGVPDDRKVSEIEALLERGQRLLSDVRGGA